MRFLALDFETSGLDPQRHAPVCIGLALMEDGEPKETLQQLIGPTFHWKTGKVEREYTIAALEVSGIKWDEIKNACPPTQVLETVRKWARKHDCQDLPVVAFNAPFDFAFYSQLLFMASRWHPTEKGVRVIPVPPLCGPWYCAKMLAHRDLSLPDYSLDTVAAHFGLSRSGEAHGALEDAVLAGKVFHLLAPTGDPDRMTIAAAGDPVGGKA